MLEPNDEIFRKDYVAPPIWKRLQDIPTIELPKEILEGLPKTKSKAKTRRLKFTSEAFANEKAEMMNQPVPGAEHLRKFSQGRQRLARKVASEVAEHADEGAQ